MKSSDKRSVQLLVNQLIHSGVSHVVISPGSRNAPLIIAFNQAPEMSCFVIPDERSAGFFALGMAQQLNKPVVIVCTSGSAALNYYPAIAEAYYQSIPLFILTADRPQSWVNQGDGQTIVQHEVFKNHVLYSVTISENEEEWHLRREISTAIYFAFGKSKGPVHINMPFSEPLYNQIDRKNENAEMEFPIKVFEGQSYLTYEEKFELQKCWNESPKKMIICGQMSPNPELFSLLKSFSEDTSVVVLAENTSNLIGSSFINCIDRTLNSISSIDEENFSPDLLISIGGAIVSKRIKTFLRKNRVRYHWKIGVDFVMMDTYQSLTHSIPFNETQFFNQLINLNLNKSSTNFGSKWKQLDFLIQEKSNEFFTKDVKFSDLVAFETILDFIPESSHLHLANSSVVRYAQLFNPPSTISYWSNRGTSGIDGSVSTACGAAVISADTWHTLITGDLSFFYDSNGLWNKVLPPNLRIFLINNGGGGIFKIIPGPKSTDELDDFFVFNHEFKAEHICKAFEIEYFSAHSRESIENQMEQFFTFNESGKPKLVEIFTPSDLNDVVLNDFFENINVKK
jgi:2-succinyl-5-enolpyruvyl-6-hydroxy-3-cyclohexene-1-carboxylate synthase